MGSGQSSPGSIGDHCAATDIPCRTRWNLVNTATDDPKANAFIGKCPIGSYFWWIYQYSMALDSMYVFHEYAYTARKDFRYLQYYTDYINLVLRQYYQDMSDTINSHPIGYILGDLENLNNPEYQNILDEGAEGNAAKLKVNGIVSNFANTKPYPPPGILCLTGFTLKDCACSFDGQSMWWAGRFYKYGCANSGCANDDHHLCG
jgi:hypothetical protein